MGTEEVKQQIEESKTQNEATAWGKKQSIQNSRTVIGKIEKSEEFGEENQLNREFEARRSVAIEKLMEHTGIRSGDSEQHNKWFQNAYDFASGDPASVPWAELQPNKEILKWLGEHPGEGKAVIEMGCGLGDNAEALADKGWQVTAFDISEAAVNWAKARFPDTQVKYLVADLLDLPQGLLGKFDLVVDSNNLQAFVPGSLRQEAIESLLNLLSADGQLLIVSLYANEIELETGPPWPITQMDLENLKSQGMVMDMLRPTSTKVGNRLRAQVLAGFSRNPDISI